MNRKHITVMTRLRTLNIGNEALSNELLKVIQANFPDSALVPLERAPRFLAQYRFSDLPKNLERALGKFESWAENLAQRGISQPYTEPSHGNAKNISLVLAKAVSPLEISIKEKLQLRRFASKAGIYDREFNSRLALHSRAKLAILNPAGELNPKSIDPPLRMLLELRAAQLMGAKAGVVNFSVELPDSFTNDLFGSIFALFDFISVRDHQSREVLLRSGVPAEKLKTTGDLAFLAEPDFDEGKAIAKRLGISAKTIALVANGKFGSSRIQEWAELAHRLHDQGHDLVVLSNELSSDIPFAEKLARFAPVRVIPEQFSYRQYAGLLAQLRLVISSRLHTSVLALVAGTPAVPIELIARRIKGVMEEINYPLGVPLCTESNWVEEAMKNVSTILDNELAFRERITAIVDTSRHGIRDSWNNLVRF